MSYADSLEALPVRVQPWFGGRVMWMEMFLDFMAMKSRERLMFRVTMHRRRFIWILTLDSGVGAGSGLGWGEGYLFGIKLCRISCCLVARKEKTSSKDSSKTLIYSFRIAKMDSRYRRL